MRLRCMCTNFIRVQTLLDDYRALKQQASSARQRNTISMNLQMPTLQAQTRYLSETFIFFASLVVVVDSGISESGAQEHQNDGISIDGLQDSLPVWEESNPGSFETIPMQEGVYEAILSR